MTQHKNSQEPQYKTRQELFDNALNGIRGQGYRRSLADDCGRCMYRSPDGLRCAIGHSIPDSDYSSELEHRAATSCDVMRASGVRWTDSVFVTHLQVAHDDRLTSADGFEREMGRIAEEYGLNYTPPEGE